MISVVDLRHKVVGFVYNEAWLNFSFFSFLVTLATTFYFCWPLARLLSYQSESDFDEDEDSWQLIEGQLGFLQRSLALKNRELQKEKQEMGLLLNSLSECLVTVDSKLRIQFGNDQFYKVFSSKDSHLEMASAKCLFDLFRSQELFDEIQKTFESSKETLINITLELKNSRHDFSVKLIPIDDQNEVGSIHSSQVMLVFLDMTEILAAQKQRTDFVANASHELRTPLTLIKGYVDTISSDLKEGRSEGLLEFIEIVQRNVDRLMDVVNDLLSINRLEVNQILQKKVASVDEMTTSVLEELQPIIESSHCQISKVTNDLKLNCDRIKIEMVLKNLLINAIKYSPSWSQVQVAWLEESTQIVLKVVDSGPGIEPVHLHRVFERFYRIDSGRTREQGGSGLGLAIVKHIVHSHGGSVSVESQVGVGSQFICRFPK